MCDEHWSGCLGLASRRSCTATRVKRGERMLWEGKIASLRRIKDEVKEVDAGVECGILLDGYSDFREGDVIESFGQELIEIE